MMPDIDGFEFAASVCAINQNIPILFMTARDDFSSKAKGYRLGIDDYVGKPVDLEELVLRLESLLRRAKIAASKQLTVGNLMLDEDAVSDAVNGAPVPLNLREFQIIYKLLAYLNRTFTRSQLLDEFSGLESESRPRSVDVQIGRASCRERV